MFVARLCYDKDMMDLLEQAKNWEHEAGNLLAESQMQSILSPIGEVHYTGSYDYGVLLGADIDIYVFVTGDKAKGSARTALGRLIEQNYWNGYLYYDFAAHPSVYHPGFPESYYVGVKGDYQGHRWKVDIWFGQREVLNKGNDWIKGSMTDDARRIILALKQARNDGQLHAESHEMYTAVLKHGVKDVDSFRAWQG